MTKGTTVATAGVIGLDIGTTHVRAAEFQQGRGGPRSGTLVRYGEVPLPLGAVRDGEVEEVSTVATAIRQLWAGAKFSSRDVAISVGNQRVVVRELDLPWMPAGQLKASLAFHVQEILPMPVDEALLDYFPTAEYDGQQGRLVRGMLVAATRDTVRANVMAVETAGLRPKLVDLTHFALMRGLLTEDLMARTVAIVEIGARLTQVVIAAQGKPQFVRMLPTGGQNVTDAVAGALSVSHSDAEGLKRQVGVGLGHGQEKRWRPRPSKVPYGRWSRRSGTRSSTTRATIPARGSSGPAHRWWGSPARSGAVPREREPAADHPGRCAEWPSAGQGSGQRVEGRQSLVGLPLGLAMGVAA